jgi:excisionase family DNA binding protein
MPRVITTSDLDGALTVQQFASLTRLSAWTVYRKIQSGELTAISTGRKYLISRRDADAWINARRA